MRTLAPSHPRGTLAASHPRGTVRRTVSVLTLASIVAVFPACTASDALDAEPVRAASDAAAQQVTEAAQAAADAARQLGVPIEPTQASPRARRSTGAPVPATSARRASAAAAAPAPASVAPPGAVGDKAVSGEPSVAMRTVEPVPDTAPLLGAAQTGYAATAPSLHGPPARDRVYSESDRDVTPAVLLTTQHGGPVFEGVRGAVNTMELVVSREGRVETVKLLTPAMRMTDMLLLSGAKTWKFAPALKDGQPVRYRTRFSWESTP